MGCSNSLIKLEAELLSLKLQKKRIQEKKKQLGNEYEELTGKTLNKPKIPDYIDINKMRERNNPQEDNSTSLKQTEQQ